MILKIVPKDGQERTLEKIDQRERRKAKTEMRLSEQSLDFVIVLKEESRKFIFIFFFTKAYAGKFF